MHVTNQGLCRDYLAVLKDVVLGDEAHVVSCAGKCRILSVRPSHAAERVMEEVRYGEYRVGEHMFGQNISCWAREGNIESAFGDEESGGQGRK